MDAHRQAHVRPELDHPRGLPRLLRVTGSEDHQRALDASLARTGDHAIEIGGENLVGEVTV
jgi:hypothetical protein